MRKVIAAINMTLDGFCDHTAGIADAELHDHYTALLDEAGVLLYGRVTYELMESFWPALAKEPGENKAMNDFALAIDRVPKIVFSGTLKSTGWKTATLAENDLGTEILRLKKQPGKDIFVGSPSLIAQATNLGLIDEYQICVHPVILGKGLILFRHIQEEILLSLQKTKTFGAGQIVLYYRPAQSSADL